MHPQGTRRWPCALALLSALALPLAAAPVSPKVLFAVIGDYGLDDTPEADVAALVASWEPDFVTTVGDNNYDLGERSTIDANIGKHYSAFIFPHMGAYGPGAGENRFWPALGKHDWYSAEAVPIQPYLDYFTLPGNERYYEIRRDPVHLFMVDSYNSEPDGITAGSTQALWLRDRLRASGAPWQIVHVHHAPYSSSTTHGSQTTLQWPYSDWGADLVLSGHDHTYEWLTVGGLPYGVNGLGGRGIDGRGVPIPGSEVQYNGDYGAQRVDAGIDQVRLDFIARTVTRIDTQHLVPWRLDGVAEPNLAPIATQGSHRLWADRVGDWLYVATDASQGSGNDGLLFVARSPEAVQAAPWLKTGQVAAWDLVLAEDDGDPLPPAWLDATGLAVSPDGAFESHTEAGGVLEGAFDMRALWGSVPGTVHLATAGFASPDGGALDPTTQVPAPTVADGDLTSDEFFAFSLSPATEPVHPWTLDGLPELGLTPVATNAGLNLYAAQAGEWLFVATDAASAPTNDLFLWVARDRNALQSAAWSKAGSVAAWDVFLARDGADTFNDWHGADEARYLRVARFHAACEDGQWLEGAFNMMQAWGEVPPSVYLGAAEYGPGGGGSLIRQVPASIVSNGDIEGDELLEFPLTAIPAELVVFEVQ
jgi:tartrate-resistant acid phosphatase type 5